MSKESATFHLNFNLKYCWGEIIEKFSHIFRLFPNRGTGNASYALHCGCFTSPEETLCVRENLLNKGFDARTICCDRMRKDPWYEAISPHWPSWTEPGSPTDPHWPSWTEPGSPTDPHWPSWTEPWSPTDPHEQIYLIYFILYVDCWLFLMVVVLFVCNVFTPAAK